MPAILSQVEGFVGTITLNHPEKRNALSEHLVDGIIAALEDFKARNVRVVILRAPPGSGVWSAGHNVEELPEARRDPLGWDDPLRNLIRQIENFPGPVIAMIEGTVWGGACETAFACDLIVAAPTTTFAVTPAKLGVPYNVSGMMTFLNAASLRIVKELAFTARPLSAERAERLGIINHGAMRRGPTPGKTFVATPGSGWSTGGEHPKVPAQAAERFRLRASDIHRPTGGAAAGGIPRRHMRLEQARRRSAGGGIATDFRSRSRGAAAATRARVIRALRSTVDGAGTSSPVAASLHLVRHSVAPNGGSIAMGNGVLRRSF